MKAASSFSSSTATEFPSSTHLNVPVDGHDGTEGAEYGEAVPKEAREAGLGVHHRDCADDKAVGEVQLVLLLGFPSRGRLHPLLLRCCASARGLRPIRTENTGVSSGVW